MTCTSTEKPSEYIACRNVIALLALKESRKLKIVREAVPLNIYEYIRLFDILKP